MTTARCSPLSLALACCLYSQSISCYPAIEYVESGIEQTDYLLSCFAPFKLFPKFTILVFQGFNTLWFHPHRIEKKPIRKLYENKGKYIWEFSKPELLIEHSFSRMMYDVSACVWTLGSFSSRLSACTIFTLQKFLWHRYELELWMIANQVPSTAYLLKPHVWSRDGSVYISSNVVHHEEKRWAQDCPARPQQKDGLC